MIYLKAVFNEPKIFSLLVLLAGLIVIYVISKIVDSIRERKTGSKNASSLVTELLLIPIVFCIMSLVLYAIAYGKQMHNQTDFESRISREYTVCHVNAELQI